MNLQEATMRALQGKLEEAKSTDKLFTCIEDRQGGTWAVGRTMTAEEWGNTASSWAEQDDWEDPEEPLLKNFNTEQECINFIQDMWEITIVPSDSPEAKEFLGEARSHKEDNEKVAPRTDNNNVFQTRRRYGELDSVPKRARFSANKGNSSNWGYFDNDEVKTYTQSTDDIEKYKGLKADAEYERGEAERHSTWAQRKDDLAREIVNKRKLNATTDAKKTENKDGAGALDTQAYWAYVLGYDLMHDKLKQEGPECDETFIEAWKIADDFMKSEEFKNTNKSGYDALVDYLKNHNLI